MNKIVKHKFRNKRVQILFNYKKEVIGYVLENLTPKVKRILNSTFTTDKMKAKEFLTCY
jgi:Tfp pilus assembly PilM family ATPase